MGFCRSFFVQKYTPKIYRLTALLRSFILAVYYLPILLLQKLCILFLEHPCIALHFFIVMFLFYQQKQLSVHHIPYEHTISIDNYYNNTHRQSLYSFVS